jgi:mono/diheme cytochrome c family protein
MNFRLLLLIAASVIIFTAACEKTSTTSTTNTKSASSPTATAKPDEFAVVRGSFSKNCAKCHGENGDGGPVKLDDGTKLKVPSLRTGHALHHPDSDFVKQITKGGDGMPAFKDKMSSPEIDDMVRFVRHEFQAGQTPPAEPAKR